MIRCVCLVAENEKQILLVQAHHRAKYYFPGGKIDAGETQIDALIREVSEELNLDLIPSELEYIDTVIGPAYPQKNEETELNCYRALCEIDWNTLRPSSEITDLCWVDKKDTEKIAPAVLKWIKKNKKDM